MERALTVLLGRERRREVYTHLASAAHIQATPGPPGCCCGSASIPSGAAMIWRSTCT